MFLPHFVDKSNLALSFIFRSQTSTAKSATKPFIFIAVAGRHHLRYSLSPSPPSLSLWLQELNKLIFSMWWCEALYILHKITLVIRKIKKSEVILEHFHVISSSSLEFFYCYLNHLLICLRLRVMLLFLYLIEMLLFLYFVEIQMKERASNVFPSKTNSFLAMLLH